MGCPLYHVKVHHICMNKPEYECADLVHLCSNEGMIAVALESKALIGSPRYLILLGLVLVSGVILLAKSLDTFLPISAPKPLNKPPSENPIAESADAPMASPLAAPTPTISFLIIFFVFLCFIMGLICYLIQLEHRMSYLVLYHMDYYLLFYISFLKPN